MNMQRDSLREVRRSEPSAPRLNWFLWIFGPVVILVAGTAFVFKLIEFLYAATTTGPDALGSFLMPVLTYLLVAAGYLLLFLWAYASGQFRDVEAPKYRMLDMQDEIDRLESRKPAGRP
jgi:cbb3-type cytochrome oxidase maturation protein